MSLVRPDSLQAHAAIRLRELLVSRLFPRSARASVLARRVQASLSPTAQQSILAASIICKSRTEAV